MGLGFNFKVFSKFQLKVSHSSVLKIPKNVISTCRHSRAFKISKFQLYKLYRSLSTFLQNRHSLMVFGIQKSISLECTAEINYEG